MAAAKQNWQDIAAAKQASLLSSIPAEWLIPKELMPAEDVLDVTTFPKSSGLFTLEELQIIAAGVVEIIEQISHKKWSAQEVTRAFCKAAAVAHQLVLLDLGTLSTIS
jgi:amidase